ncbi:1-phosphatidylinositol-3-phosphate 5-kinase, partial [Ascosphaera atra]
MQDAASLTSENNAPRPEPSLHITKTRDIPDQLGGLSRTSSPVQAFSKAESFPKEYKLGLSSSTTPPTQKVSAIPRPQDKARLSAHGIQTSARKSPQPGERSGQGHVPQRSIGAPSTTTHHTTPAVVERRLHDRNIGLGVKPSKVSAGHSMIPRSVQPPKKPSRVSSLARHFEQLSREFENERQKARQQRANSIRLSRAIPTRSSNPIVQVYKNVHDAVERDPSEEDILPRGAPETIPEQPASMPADVPSALQPPAQVQRPESPASEAVASSPDTQPLGEGYEETGERESERTEQTPEPNQTPKDDEAIYSDEEKQEEELPKHERVSLIKTLTNFWAERSSSNWTALDYPLSTFDHVFEDSDIIVREDEPSSLIAFALDSEDYKQKLAACQSVSEPKGSDTSLDEADSACEDSLLRETGTHLKYQFQESQSKMTCKIFYAEQFDALRRKCGVSHRIVESLSRCMKWDSQGGKSQSLFLKTMDQRFILKSLSPMESQAFLKFAPGYFSIMSEVLFHELPSAIAKMFGFYQVIIKNPATDVEFD